MVLYFVIEAADLIILTAQKRGYRQPDVIHCCEDSSFGTLVLHFGLDHLDF